MRVLLVGSGVAAAGFLHHAEKRGLLIDHVSSPTNAPPCSFNSTAVAALRGTRSGLSPLGDELVEGWREAEAFYSQYQGAGVERATHTTAIFESEKHLRRFSHLAPTPAPLDFKRAAQLCVQEEAFLIRPQEFLRPFQGREAFVVALQPDGGNWCVEFLGGRKETYQQIVLATGVWMNWMKGLLPVPEQRAVQGSFFHWNDMDLGDRSFSLTIDDDNVVFHAREKVLLLGATSIKDETGEVPELNELKQRYQRVQERLNVKLPETERASIRTGIRAVTKDRAPFAKMIAPGVHAIGGLYKNGWVMAWRLGRLTAEAVSSSCRA